MFPIWKRAKKKVFEEVYKESMNFNKIIRWISNNFIDMVKLAVYDKYNNN